MCDTLPIQLCLKSRGFDLIHDTHWEFSASYHGELSCIFNLVHSFLTSSIYSIIVFYSWHVAIYCILTFLGHLALLCPYTICMSALRHAWIPSGINKVSLTLRSQIQPELYSKTKWRCQLMSDLNACVYDSFAVKQISEEDHQLH